VNPYSLFGQILFFFRMDIQNTGGLQFKEGMFDALLALSEEIGLIEELDAESY
jgi:hypothetical protein